MNRKRRWLISLAIEIPIYALIIVAYFYLVLKLSGRWITELYDTDKRLYATVSLALILGQGILLEVTTTFLLRIVRKRIR